ncbi:uncharacterized protein LOC130746323 [Lotus japonicus]|uniref:uncharacterized protein LOC130746323 n=1 Tax=Lotus japonicus TaxID=34305 RepID=UPI00258A50CE|nr:uncharacterized protein LOC130746323 [Lotus japonicus]
MKPLTRGSLDVAVLLCLRDTRHNNFHDSLLGTIESSLSHGPIFFNCYPDLTVSLDDKNILDVLFLNIKLHGYDMKEGSIPITLIYRVQYKVMNSIKSHFLKTSCEKSGETTLFLTDNKKANIIVPKTIQWNDITLPEKWSIERATPAQSIVTPDFRDVIQHQTGQVDLVFDRRNSFSLPRSIRTKEDFRSTMSRRSFSMSRTNSISRAQPEPSHDESTIHLTGFETTTPVKTTYQMDNDDQRSTLSPTYSSIETPNFIGAINIEFTIDKESLRKDFYSEEWTPQREWFFKNYQGQNRKNIQEPFYRFLELVQQNIPFFNWFHAYTIKKGINYPYQVDVITWQLSDEKTIQSDVPPKAPFVVKNAQNLRVLASPFKTKSEEAVTWKDIKDIMEQANYTNKYLQQLGDEAYFQLLNRGKVKMEARGVRESRKR